ncbi:MAG: DJ-1/PfpI/YhbO family deglycase/protease [Candidatus Eisenbacteria bacterium]|nr:DJ-1/PfpI/YhbO family deglycase/protease [Candidatus Eisenbacteria bacterium]
MAKIAVMIDKLFEDPEYAEPARRFREKGHELTHLGLEAGSAVTGKRGEERVTVDLAAGDANPEDYGALFIPGGYSPDRLRAKEAPVNFVRRFVQSGRPVFLICHAPQLLITADVLRGRTVTGYVSIRQDIVNAGANFKDEPVVHDGNLVSSRNPGDIPDFTAAALQKLKEK